MKSLKNRLLFSSTLVLIVAIATIGFIIERAYIEKTTASLKLRLQAEIFDLIRIADLDSVGVLEFPSKLSNRQLITPKSGLYAAVAYNGKVIWKSESNHGMTIPYEMNLQSQQKLFNTLKLKDGSKLFLLSQGYTWYDDDGRTALFTFNIAESDLNYNKDIQGFRHILWTWLVIILLALFIIQTIVLRWGLTPLNIIRKDLADIEEGKREYLDSNYVNEISGLTNDLNTLLKAERSRQQRYKNSLGDLAHSFKTPLAVIKSAINHHSISDTAKQNLQEQIDVLNDLVTYQLRRAQAAGTKSSLRKPVVVGNIVRKISGALAKVYRDKNIQVILNVNDESLFYGDDGDLLEVLGNLLDNAHKWCKSLVQVTVTSAIVNKNTAEISVLTMIIEDDGQGIENNKKEEILKRGIRADEKIPGHGIGMSIITDIINVYEGELEVADSSLGGAKFTVRFIR